jgi:hypothetical protein
MIFYASAKVPLKNLRVGMQLFLGTTREDHTEWDITRRGQKKQMGARKLFFGTSLFVTFWAMPKSINKKNAILIRMVDCLPINRGQVHQ